MTRLDNAKIHGLPRQLGMGQAEHYEWLYYGFNAQTAHRIAQQNDAVAYSLMDDNDESASYWEQGFRPVDRLDCFIVIRKNEKRHREVLGGGQFTEKQPDGTYRYPTKLARIGGSGEIELVPQEED